MTPIYASNRIDLSGWYAYQQPPGEVVLWDGGFNRVNDYSRVGIWSAITGQPIYRDPSWLAKLPQVPMYGHLDGDHFHVTDFPHVSTIQPFLKLANPAWSLESEEGTPLPYFVSILNGPIMVADCDVASFVRCCILPEDRETSLLAAREMGDNTLMRHPMSVWALKRNPTYASTQRPPRVVSRIREVEIDNDGYVGRIHAWTNPETLATFYPMYWGDQYPENNVFVPTERMNLYIAEGIVLGYD